VPQSLLRLRVAPGDYTCVTTASGTLLRAVDPRIKIKKLKLPIAAQEYQTANRPFYRAVQIASLKDHDCFKENMLTYLPWMSVRSVIACLYLLSGTVVCPWWTHLFSIYTHHNLILLFVLNLSFLSILPPSVPRSMKPERCMNMSGYADCSIMHTSFPDVIFANFCTWVTLASLIVGQVWYIKGKHFTDTHCTGRYNCFFIFYICIKESVLKDI
jgi:hypothetical protein